MIKVLKSFVVGPLEEYAPGVADEMVRVGYTSSSASQHMAFVAHLSRWMVESNRTVGKLTVEVLEQFFASRQVEGYVNYRTMKSARLLLRLLRPTGSSSRRPKQPRCSYCWVVLVTIWHR